jgi:ABC-type dipeptide/oligopeptide/nickel transport system permease component
VKTALLIAGAFISALICIWLAWLPLGILFGKLPNPPANQILDVAARYSLPALVTGLVFLAGSFWFARKRSNALAAAILLVAAPMATFGTLYLVFLR